jgi:hypothetical protein
MPIFDITFRTPLPSALMRLATAFSGGAEADEQRDVVDLANVAGLHEEADPGAGLLADQVVVHR